MSNVRFKYTKEHKYKCTRCGTDYDDLPIYCQQCASEILKNVKETDKPPKEYFDLFSPSDRGY